MLETDTICRDKSDMQQLIVIAEARYKAALEGDIDAIISYLKDVAGW